MHKIRWGILGCGGIARAFGGGVAGSETGTLAAVASRDLAKARAFAGEHGAGRAHGAYEALLADAGVDAVYIATPHPMHARWAILAAEAGKHVLCEKPLTMNLPEAQAVVLAAREAGVLLMEAFMYRCHPQTAKVAGLVREGAVGEVQMVRAAFSFRGSLDPAGRHFSNELGGGGILDVGCYPVSMARLVAGAAQGLPFADPVSLNGVARLSEETGVDLWASASALFPGGVVAQLACGVGLRLENHVRIDGTEGWIEVRNPWTPNREPGRTVILAGAAGAAGPREIEVVAERGLYALEADAFGRALLAGEKACARMTPEDTLGNMAALDAWRQSAGVRYASDKAGVEYPTVHGRPLRRRAGTPIPAARITGVEPPVARLVMGVDHPTAAGQAAVLFDDYFERGGNAFDTAWVYGGGRADHILGWWIRTRGVRGEVVVLGKGCHTPMNRPELVAGQVRDSLDRMRTEYIDMYLLHRDNTDIPAGEFVDALDAEWRAGRIRAFGGSNWSAARMREANAHARAKGRQPFTLWSNQFSLARMLDAVWGGCLSASGEESLALLREGGLTLLPWSSQARGFFTDRAGRDKRDNAELVRCWYSEENFLRRDRAVAIAARKGVEPIAVALAWVLAQPFATHPLIGPRNVLETAGSLAALALKLTPAEVAWLDLQRETPE